MRRLDPYGVLLVLVHANEDDGAERDEADWLVLLLGFRWRQRKWERERQRT